MSKATITLLISLIAVLVFSLTAYGHTEDVPLEEPQQIQPEQPAEEPVPEEKKEEKKKAGEKKEREKKKPHKEKEMKEMKVDPEKARGSYSVNETRKPNYYAALILTLLVIVAFGLVLVTL